MVADMTDCFLALMLPGAGDELQGIKRGLLELVDVMAINKADGPSLPAAQLAARQYQAGLQSLLGHHQQVPPVLTCSALQNHRIDAVWEAIEQRYEQLRARGELAERHRRQGIRWLWAIIEDRLHQAVREHPQVDAIREHLEAGVLAGTIPPEVAARRILEAFGLPDGKPPER
jgi:LAO/AO transport system kinase